MLTQITCTNKDVFTGTNLVIGTDFATLDLVEGGQLSLPADDIASQKTVKSGPNLKVKSAETSLGSKKDRALAIFQQCIDYTRQEVLAKFMSDLGMSKAGASTYYAMCKRWHNGNFTF